MPDHRAGRIARTLLLAAGVLLLVLVVTSARGTSQTEHGCADVRVTNDVTGGQRFFTLRADDNDGDDASNCTTNTNPPEPWEFDAGEDHHLRFSETTQGITPPPSPDEYRLYIVWEDSDENTVSNRLCTLFEGGVPGPVETHNVWATDDCTATGTPIAGTVRIYIRVIFTSAVAPNYDCDTDGDFTTEAGRSCTTGPAGGGRDKGLRIRANVTDLTVNDPPAGTIFAYGPTGDETADLTLDGTHPYITDTHQHITLELDDGTTNVNDGAQDWDDTNDPTDALTIDNRFPATTTTFNAQARITGTSPVTGERWTIWTTTIPSHLVRVSNTLIRNASAADINSSIRTDTDASPPPNDLVNTEHAIYNRGETVDYNFAVLNARDEQVTKATTVEVRDRGTGTLEDTRAVSSNATGFYVASYPIAATDEATNDFTGAAKWFRANYGDNNADSDDAHTVSSLYPVDVHTQNSATLVRDFFPNENGTEEVTFVSGEDVINLWCHVVGIRFDRDIDTGANQITSTLRDTEGNVVGSSTHQTNATGWSNAQLQEPAVPPTGEWEAECVVNHLGNTNTLTQNIDVISAFTGDKRIRIVFWDPYINETGESVIRVWAETELGDSSISPDSIPEIRIGQVIRSDMGDSFVATIVQQGMRNAQNQTTTVNGSLYFFDFDGLVPAGNYSLSIKAFIDGTPVRSEEPFEIQGDTMTTFETVSGLTALELGFFAIVSFAAIWVWSRSLDQIVRAFAGALVTGAGALQLLVAVESETPWVGSVPLAIIVLLVGAYLLIRTLYDTLTEATGGP